MRRSFDVDHTKPTDECSTMNHDLLLHRATTGAIISAFRDVYNGLGPGLLEHLYVRALEYELRKRGHTVGREVSVTVYYDGFELGTQRLDMIVDECVAVEAKSTFAIPPDAGRQLFNYLRVSQLEVGMLLHFGPERPSFRRILCRHASPGRAARQDGWRDATAAQDDLAG